MAIISETELRRRLLKLEKSGGSSSSGTANIKKVGDHYEYENDWVYIAYASALTNLSGGVIPNQSDASDFQYTPFDSAGNLLAYRGVYTNKSIYASGDPTDYTWEAISSGNLTASSQRYYTTSLSLLFELGTPDDPGTGITWTQLTSGNSAPGNAIWLAEQYTINGVNSNWSIAPLQGNDKTFLIAAGAISTVMPTLGDSTWITDSVAVVTAFTGKAYSNQKEFGYGTVVTIEYTDGKLSGLYKLSGSTDTWVSPGTFIDGDLMVDGTIRADAIAANAITADKIGANAVTANKISVDGSIEITSASGNVRSGIPDTLPTDLDSLTTSGFWLGVDDSAGKFVVGNKDQRLYWDGTGLSIKGRMLTGENIISVDGSSVATQSFRVVSNDITDTGDGYATGGTKSGAGIAGTNATTDITYEWQYNIDSTQIDKHYYPSITATSPYTISNGISLEFSLVDPGVGTVYSDGGSASMYGVGTSHPVSGNYFYDGYAVSYQSLGTTVKFADPCTVFFKVTVTADSSVTPGWSALSLEAYASGTEEYFTISTNSSGVAHTFDNTYESVQNVQITPDSNGAVWFTELGTTSVKIHSNAASTCHVRAIGY